MQSIFIRVVLAFLAFVGLVMIVGSLLPRQYELRSEITIAAPPTAVFPHINSLRKWKKWSPWNPGDLPEIDVEYGSKDTGVDAVLSWTEARGKGKVWITGSEADKAIDYNMLFSNFPEIESRISLTPVGESGEQTKVEWTSSGDLPGGPFYGFLRSVYVSGMQGQYNQALSKLKGVAESN